MILESPFNAPLRLEIPASFITLVMIVVPLLFIALVVVWYTPIHWAWLLAVILIEGVVASYFVRLHYWKNLKASILEINQDGRGQWSALANVSEDDWRLVELLPTSFVSTFLIVLNFKDVKRRRRYSVILPAGSLDDDTFRRLRVRIRVAFD